ncbi:VWA domain-containing protein [Streptococcus panodentis]|uniref:VWA domain-containing protein n=1 Tax=Streptococcus panodentis TaxID=1581472 RepID=A0ABS5AW63_9STRE|nr:MULTISPECIES: VWA domain-containing protein [Streptococcus]KXT86074.1 hypothetical protein STRDD11_00055 [Streptococcus sp. DD11]MBP2620803.1 VWA domain-containing protein [Streptococcus panodentis]
MKFKKTSLLLVLGASLVLSACSGDGAVKSKLSEKDAKTEVEAYYKKIDPKIAKLKKDISNTSLQQNEELPDIDTTYPYTVKGNGEINAEIFVSSEKAGSGKDGILNEIAESFNNQRQTIDGKTVSVSIRSIPSGTSVDYIASKNHVPDGYTPSNQQWNYILNARGTATTQISERLFGNTSGLLMKKNIYDEIKKAYGDVTVENLAKAVNDGKLLGYTNPYTSSTGLSLLSQLLFSFDKENPISDTAKTAFQQFQNNIPSTFVTTTQLREAAKSGSADILSISYQTYINTPEFSDYEYVPFGIRQDSPLYATTNDSSKQEVLKKFSSYILEGSNQSKASSYGFNQLEDYSFEEQTTDGNLLMSMQNLWKKNKNNSQPIVGVFVTDVSGSMDGDPMNNLKKSLLNSLQYINEENQIGLVSYSDDVTINVPIDRMNSTQKSYFTSAIKGLTPSGGTATYDGTLVAVKMILDKMKENPDARPIIFVLSDGQTNGGYEFERVEPIIKALGITVNTIGYNADLEELARLSKINESVSIDASNDDVIYKLKELFNAEF